MTDFIAFNEEIFGRMIAAATKAEYYPKVCPNVCRVRDGDPVGGVMWSNFTGESVAMHVAGFADKWLNRDLLYVSFDYPFNQLGVKRVFGFVPETNMHAREIAEGAGFTQVDPIKGMFPGNTSCLVYRLDRDDCRFLTVKPRKVTSTKTMWRH